ncbi:protein kinase [bacterium]|nr:protein kinase [bacterium]
MRYRERKLREDSKKELNKKTDSGSLSYVGSLTQWLLGRTPPNQSESSYYDDSESSFESSGFCPDCGLKRRVAGQGSLTQWIFQSHHCRCEITEADRGSTDAGAVSHEVLSMPAFKLDDDYEAVEEDVFPDGFPVERYRCIKRLGGGASGAVYLAIDKRLGKRVAIKLLKVTDEKQYIEFQNEARAISRLNHRGIVEVYDFALSDAGAPYMVMEYFPGRTLRSYLDEQGPFSESEAVPLFLSLTRALAHAHSKGIFHRDLKPENILILEEDDVHLVKVVDFGLVRILKEGSLSKGESGKVLTGTPWYMSPDMARGLPFDEASEVYSLGTVMYEVLSGKLPFTAESSLALMALKGTEQPPSLLELEKNGRGGSEGALTIAPELADIVAFSLAPEPSERIRSMVELEEALLKLSALQADESEISEPVENLSKTPGGSVYSDRQLSVFSILVIAVLMLFALAFALLIFSDGPGGVWKVDVDKSSKKGNFRGETDLFSKAGMYDVDKEQEFSPGLVQHMQRLKGLYGERVLRVARRKITFKDMEDFRRRGIVALELPACKLDDIAVAQFSRLERLRSLNLTRCDLAGRSLSFLKPLVRLERINLADCGFDESELQVLGELPSLMSIYMPDSGLSDKSIYYFCRCENLEWLNVNGNRISGRALLQLRSLTKLSQVHCLGCRVSPKERVMLRKAMPQVEWEF